MLHAQRRYSLTSDANKPYSASTFQYPICTDGLEENFIACITVNPDVDNRPEIMPDGRIIYMRWDYNHRTQLDTTTLTIGPDGYGDMIYLGNEKP
ncbi:MAG: hypothetical protein ACLUKN_11750 [Bacilli bacterium]